jgi:hypothetical protein
MNWRARKTLAALARRIPVLLAAAISLMSEFANGSASLDLITPATLIACHLLGIRADLTLFGSNS